MVLHRGAPATKTRMMATLVEVAAAAAAAADHHRGLATGTVATITTETAAVTMAGTTAGTETAITTTETKDTAQAPPRPGSKAPKLLELKADILATLAMADMLLRLLPAWALRPVFLGPLQAWVVVSTT